LTGSPTRGGRDPRWGKSGVMCFCAPEPAKNGIGKQNKLNGKIRTHVCQGTTLLALCVCPLLGENGKSEVREAEVSDADIPTGVCAAIPWD